jgi:predicted transcriptional regulator
MQKTTQKCNPLSCLLSCILNLNCTEAEVYLALLEKPNSDVEEIARSVGRDRTTVYRTLQSLVEKGFVLREYRILKSGGFKYLYKPIPLQDIRTKAMTVINMLVDEIEKMFEQKT